MSESFVEQNNCNVNFLFAENRHKVGSFEVFEAKNITSFAWGSFIQHQRFSILNQATVSVLTTKSKFQIFETIDMSVNGHH